MSNVARDVKFSLKVMINKQKTKVLFAEADGDFADVLLSFLTLSLGTIVRILEKHYGDMAPVIGSLTTLYNSLSNLDGVHFWTESGKQMLLKTRNSSETECRKLKLNVDDTQPMKYFRCEDMSCRTNIGMYYDTARCRCGRTLRHEIKVRERESSQNDGDAQVFSIKTASFIICDDLRVVPNVDGSVLETLSNIGITDTLGAEIRNVTFGFNESPNGEGYYVKGPRMYMVTDDLTVTPLCVTSSLSILNALEIPLSDIKELEVNIGLEEALRILKASLTSACALTDSLINPPSFKKSEVSINNCIRNNNCSST